MEIYIRAFSIWVLIALLEVVHGIVRAKVIAPKTGDLRSRQIGVFTGSLIFFVITMMSFEWMGIKTASEALTIGGIWLFCMLIFEFSVGYFVFHFSLKFLLNDFNVMKGRLLAFGMLFLALSPYIVGKIRADW